MDTIITRDSSIVSTKNWDPKGVIGEHAVKDIGFSDAKMTHDAGQHEAVVGTEVLCATETDLTFRRFTLLPGARILLQDGQAVEIGARAFDLLHILAVSRGTVVSKQEIMRKVWPTTIVEECNLRFQVGVLRRALGPDGELIRTILGRGYLMVQEIPTASRPKAPPPAEVFGPRRARSLENREFLHAMLRAALDELREMGESDSLGSMGTDAAIAG